MMKVLYISTISNTINAFMVPHIELLLDQNFKVDIACNVVRDINPRLIERGCRVFNIEFQRSLKIQENYKAYRKLKKLINDGQYDVIHTHTPIASTIARLVCRKKENINVIYTAHGFHFFKGAPLRNWLVYYSVERWLARYTDLLITINEEDYRRAQRFKAKQVLYIPGVGLDKGQMEKINININKKKTELNIPNNAFVILSVGELNRNKNHETIIKALARLNNPNLFYIICGSGPLEKTLQVLISTLKLDKQVRLLGFRSDVKEIYRIADVFVLPSHREGLSVALMEAMASRLPVICSDIRGNRDLVIDQKGGYLIKSDNIDSFANSIQTLLCSSELCIRMGKFNESYIKNFELSVVLQSLQEVYSL